jgi:glutamate racemase
MIKGDSNHYQVHPGYVNPAHTADTSTVTGRDTTKTTEQLTNVESLLKAYPERHIGKFFNPGGLEEGVRALNAAKHVMLSTGFNVEEGMPETDGPPGLAALAHALIQTGKTVTFVTDSTNKRLVKACLDVLNPNAAKYCRFETFDIKPEHLSEAEAKATQYLDLREAEIKAEKKANQLLDTYKPDLVLTLELAGRGQSGVAKNMRGKAITGFNAMVDEVLNQANKKKITTVAVGDGGNEAGMGELKGIPNALDGTAMQARTQAGIQVTSWNSNLGGEALAAGVLAKHGMLDKLHTPEQQTAMIKAVTDGGGVDGVTRGSILGEESTDSLGRPVQTGVDGFHPEVHRGTLRMLKNIASTIPPDNGLVAKATAKNAPFQIAAFDSGAGGLVAAHNLANFIQYRSNHNARFICISDFGEAPYGAKSRPELIHLVGKGLKTAETVGVDVIAMACNTACTSFKSGPNDKEGLDLNKDFNLPVIDLIAITAEAIATHGGDKPVVLSTEATANDDMYEDRIKAAALTQGKNAGINESEIGMPEVVRVGAGDKADPGKDWASLINQMKHLSKNDADRKEFKEIIAKYVAKIPADSSSVWLCCTHYPAIKTEIENALKDRNLGHIDVIDPMEYQAEAIIKKFDEINALQTSEATSSKGKGTGKMPIDLSNRTRDTTPLVITSGKIAEATTAAKHLLKSPVGARVLSAKLTGESFNMSLIGPDMYQYDLKAPTVSSFDSDHSLWKVPGPGEKSQKTKLLKSGSDSSSGPSSSNESSDQDSDKAENVRIPSPHPQVPTQQPSREPPVATPPINLEDLQKKSLDQLVREIEEAEQDLKNLREQEPLVSKFELKDVMPEWSVLIRSPTLPRSEFREDSAIIDTSEPPSISTYLPESVSVQPPTSLTQSPSPLVELTPELGRSSFKPDPVEIKSSDVSTVSLSNRNDVQTTSALTDERFITKPEDDENPDTKSNGGIEDDASTTTTAGSSRQLENRFESVSKAFGNKITRGGKFKRHSSLLESFIAPPEKKSKDPDGSDGSGGSGGATLGT